MNEWVALVVLVFVPSLLGFFSLFRTAELSGGPFVTLVAVVPALFGYAVVGFGAGWCGFWSFNVTHAIRGVPVYIGVAYSGYLNGCALLVPESLIALGNVVGPAATALICGLVFLLVATLVDIVLIRGQILEVYNAAYAVSRSAEVVVMRYCLPYFFSVGVFFGLVYAFGLSRMPLEWSWGVLLVIAGTSVGLAAPYVIFFGFVYAKQRHGDTQAAGGA